jgi:hypothetical protein
MHNETADLAKIANSTEVEVDDDIDLLNSHSQPLNYEYKEVEELDQLTMEDIRAENDEVGIQIRGGE